jgi:hypothetical protein
LDVLGGSDNVAQPSDDSKSDALRYLTLVNLEPNVNDHPRE